MKEREGVLFPYVIESEGLRLLDACMKLVASKAFQDLLSYADVVYEDLKGDEEICRARREARREALYERFNLHKPPRP